MDVICSAVDLSMRDVRLKRHQLLRDRLIQVYLPSADGIPRSQSPIIMQHPVSVNLDVDMNGTSNIETRNYRFHLHHPINVSGLHPPQECGVISV